jgi:hypothetical protein
VPLWCDGSDAVSNLQWQTIRSAKAKDRWEPKGVRTLGVNNVGSSRSPPVSAIPALVSGTDPYH